MKIDKFDEKVKKCCFTGYRPEKLPFNINIKNKEYNDFENLIMKYILQLSDKGCGVFYTGMAMGFDILCAECVLLIRKIYKMPLKLVCVIPFDSQSLYYSDYWKRRYDAILRECDEVKVLSDKYFKGCYQKRNIYMVDNSDYVLTWFDGKSGGTKNTIDYAIKQNRFVFNMNENANEDYFPQEVFEIF